MKKETVINILDKHIASYNETANNVEETRIRRSIAENFKKVVESIKEDVLNAVEDD